jgi:muramoyltetrapeptide carboxypeptidase LdcA involved in peptidoglycan recycling
MDNDCRDTDWGLRGRKEEAVILPPRLKTGDAIGIVSPSWGGAGLYPQRVQQGIRQLQALGFQVRLAPHALNQHGFVSDTPSNRAHDIHSMFADPTIKAIIAAVGGDHSCHLLPLLDFELIGKNPKIFMGFSDITVLNIAIWSKTGLVTFNGPSLLTDFAEYPHMLSYTERYFLKAVSGTGPVGLVEPSPDWTEEYIDWATEQAYQRPRHRLPSTGWTWLKSGRAEGRLLGGCLESLQHLRGTSYWPDWRDSIFFFETSEEKPSPETVDGILMDYENMGIFEQIDGLIVGRPMRYSDDDKRSLRGLILERTHRYTFPIITDMDFGHTSPQFTLPIGPIARIDTHSRRFEIIGAAVE